jgi:predicted PurR-regulated permease PerM
MTDDQPPAVPVPSAGTHARLARWQYLWVVGALAALAALLHWLGPVLTPFIFGAILSYLGLPIVHRCQGLRMSRTAGTLVAVTLMGIAILGLLLVIVPLVQAEIGLVMRRLPELTDRFTSTARPWLNTTFGMELRFDLAELKELITEHADGARQLSLQMLGSVKTGGLMLIGILINIALTPVVMFYLLRDWNQILARIDFLIPRRWSPLVRSMGHDIDHVLSEFLHGQLLVMVSLAAYYCVGLWIAGLQFALPIGILTGLLVFIPYVGFGIGLILGMLAALLQWNGLPGFLAILAVYGVGQLLENYVLIPLLVGQRIGLHPLAVIFALMAFGQLFGFAGVLMALPVSAVLLVGLRHLRATYLESPLYRDH